MTPEADLRQPKSDAQSAGAAMPGRGRASPDWRDSAAARWLVIVAAACGVLALVVRVDAHTRLWRSAYPHLPARAQAAPYLAASWLRNLDGAEQPAAIPTPADHGGVTGTAPTEAAAGSDGRAVASPPQTGLDTPEPPPEYLISSARHTYQTWNNCGPATVSMALSAHGWAGDQSAVARALKPDPNDKNVGPEELARFARDAGFEALVGQAVDRRLLMALIASGVPPIVETWFVPEPGDEMGHYRLLVGYRESGDVFIAHDSYSGPATELTWQSLDEHWRVFNRTFVAIYPSELQPAVAGAIGLPTDSEEALRARLRAAEAEVAERGDAFAWFNLGTSRLAIGDSAGAAEAYDEARTIGLPWRMLWYQFGPYEAYAAVGRWQDVEVLAETTLSGAGNLEESLFWLGSARAAQGDLEAARALWRRANTANPGYEPARRSLERDGAPAR